MKKILFSFLFYTIVFLLMGQPAPQFIPVAGNWQFSEGGRNQWQEAIIPGTVHQDLLRLGLLPDPFYGTNEEKIQWVENKDWEYKTTFTLTAEQLAYAGAVLAFQGLDTYADVYLNGAHILKAENMFVGYEVPVKELLKPGENRLHVYFYSAVEKALPQAASNGFDYPADNDRRVPHTSVYTRKAPYQYGWDWGIRMVGCGIWRPVILKLVNKADIKDYRIRQMVINKEMAEVNNELMIHSMEKIPVDVEIKFSCLLNGQEKQRKRVRITLQPGDNKVSAVMSVSRPALWMPAGWGEQPLYDFRAEVIEKDGTVVSGKEQRVGLRSIRVVNEEDASGKSFYFEVNGLPLFAKGANYIPGGVIAPNVSEAAYRQLFENVKAANMNMLRVWGGGIYEDDYFYRLADENGILIWQDFMFACTPYPADPAFLKLAEAEAEYNLKRLRNYACIALWCGNNEVYEALKYWGFKKRIGDENYQALFPAYDKLFRELLPEKVNEWDAGRFYLHSSPGTANWGRKESLPYGDSHYWGVWYGKEPFEVFDNTISRFMSEFGFQAFPEMKTITAFARPGDYSLDADVMKAHQKSSTGSQLIKEYMERYYHVPENFEDFVYVGLVLQGQGMRHGIEAHRRNRPFCMGSLYWQLNDNWPVVSWSGIDYYGNWKALHYQAKRAFEPVLINVAEENGILNYYLISDELHDRKGLTLESSLMDFEGKVLEKERRTVDLMANSTRKVHEQAVVISPEERTKTFLKVTLKDTEGKELSRYVFYFEWPKNLHLPETNISRKVNYADGRYEVTLTADKLAKDVFIQLPVQGARFTDNFFDLLPGESKRIMITAPELKKAEKTKLTIKHLRATYE